MTFNIIQYWLVYVDIIWVGNVNIFCISIKNYTLYSIYIYIYILIKTMVNFDIIYMMLTILPVTYTYISIYSYIYTIVPL